MRRFSLAVLAGLALAPIGASVAGPSPTDTISTTGSFGATYGTASQTSPRIPWSDLGLQAGASVTQGTLSGTVGGSTQYQLTSSISGGETFTAGLTTVDLGYTPGWTGSMTTSAANGTLGVSLGYSIGPINGSVPLLTDSMTTGGTFDFSGALNSGSGASHSTTTPGLGVSGGFGLKVIACPIICFTAASASIGFHVGSQTTQNLDVTPGVSYGDLLWYSNGSNSTIPVNVAGGGGTVTNTFTTPDFTALGLPSTGGTFDMNILPYAALSLGVGNEATVSIPASLSYSYNVLGAGGSGSTSGTLYALSTGTADITAAGTWYAPDVYSLELTGSCTASTGLCSYGTLNTADPLGLTTSGIPGDVPLGNGPPGPPGGGGGSSGFPLLGSLLPPGLCPPTAPPGECTVTLTRSVPEPDAGWLLAAGMLLLGLARRSRRPSAAA